MTTVPTIDMEIFCCAAWTTLILVQVDFRVSICLPYDCMLHIFWQLVLNNTISLDLTSTSDFILSSKNFIKLSKISFLKSPLWFAIFYTFSRLSITFWGFYRIYLIRPFFLSRNHLVSYFAPGTWIFVFHSLCGFATRSSAPQQNRPFCKIVITTSVVKSPTY